MNSASTPATTATIFHNPACSNSRGALQLLRERGIEPLVIDYLATPLTAPELAELVAHMGQPVRELLRSKEAQYQTLGIDNPAMSDSQIFALVAQHPRHANRPDLKFMQPLSGWWGHAAPFQFTPDYQPAPGITAL